MDINKKIKKYVELSEKAIIYNRKVKTFLSEKDEYGRLSSDTDALRFFIFSPLLPKIKEIDNIVNGEKLIDIGIVLEKDGNKYIQIPKELNLEVGEICMIKKTKYK